MKSLNDLIWNEDVDLEEEKEDDVTISRMQQICIVDNCIGGGGGIDRPLYHIHFCPGI